MKPTRKDEDMSSQDWGEDLADTVCDHCNFENASFKDLTDTVFLNCNLKEIDIAQAGVKGVHVHDCAGMEKNTLVTCCWTCSRFDTLSDEAPFKRVLTSMFNPGIKEG